MKRAKADIEVQAPNGERFVVGWAETRWVVRHFGSGLWAVAVMRGQGASPMNVVYMEPVADAESGLRRIRRLATEIQAGTWSPPVALGGGQARTQLGWWSIPFLFAIELVWWIGISHLAFGLAALLAFGIALALTAMYWYTWRHWQR